MSSGMYVGLSGQLALERRLATIAENVANMNTPGFRAEEVRFDSVISRAGGVEVAYAGDSESFLSRKAGAAVPTGNPLDVAIDGDGWLAIETPAGIAYTRDGRMHISENGELLSVAGYPVLDRGGGPILIDPAGGPPVIADDGMITQGDRQIGALGVFMIPEGARLTRFDNASVVPDTDPDMMTDMVGNGVRQGFVEGSNVNPIQEMTRLIAVTRAFDNAVAATQKQEDVAEQAIRILGPS